MDATNHPALSAPAGETVSRALRAHIGAAERSCVPTAIVRVDSHRIHCVNEALAAMLGRSSDQLRGLGFASLCCEPEPAAALIERAWSSRAAELAPTLGYAHGDGKTLLAATLVQPIVGSSDPVVLVQVLDTSAPGTESIAAAEGPASTSPHGLELREANERLVLASLREHQQAERATAAASDARGLLERKCLLAEASVSLQASLELPATLRTVTGLAVPGLADGCVLRLYSEGQFTSFIVADVDPARAQRLEQRQDELACATDLCELTARVAQTGVCELYQAPPSEAPCEVDLAHAQAAIVRELQISSAFALPLHVRGAVMGVLVLLRGSVRRFQPDDLDLAMELARLASTAIDNARLYDEAQRAVRIRDDVLAIVSHDLRNPLSAITMSVHRLLKHMGPSDPLGLRTTLSLIHRSSKHMRRLIEELLEVANIDSGQLQLEYSSVSAQALIREAVDMLAPTAQLRGVQLAEHVHDRNLSIPCDMERVVRVLANLGGNALKFTPRGGGIEITASRQGEFVCFDVTDTGPGVAKADQPKLFERYWKGARTGRNAMGLGLYIARGIVEAHGGNIWVDSDPPHGATFSFCLPLTSPSGERA